VNPAGLYRVGGGSLRSSEPFNMPRPAGPVVIDAHVGSNVKHWVGFGLMMGGIAAAGAGTFEIATTGSSDVISGDAWAALITGLVLISVGIPLFATSYTSVDVR
jgi:hypothetical protein